MVDCDHWLLLSIGCVLARHYNSVDWLWLMWFLSQTSTTDDCCANSFHSAPVKSLTIRLESVNHLSTELFDVAGRLYQCCQSFIRARFDLWILFTSWGKEWSQNKPSFSRTPCYQSLVWCKQKLWIWLASRFTPSNLGSQAYQSMIDRGWRRSGRSLVDHHRIQIAYRLALQGSTATNQTWNYHAALNIRSSKIILPLSRVKGWDAFISLLNRKIRCHGLQTLQEST